MGLAVIEQHVLLSVVEVRLELDARIGFFSGDVDRSKVDAVPFQSGLQEDAFGCYGGEIEG